MRNKGKWERTITDFQFNQLTRIWESVMNWKHPAAHLLSIPDHKPTSGTTTLDKNSLYILYMLCHVLSDLCSNIAVFVVNVIFYLYIGDKGGDIERGSTLIRPHGKLADGSVPGKSLQHSDWLRTEFSLLPQVRLTFLWMHSQNCDSDWEDLQPDEPSTDKQVAVQLPELCQRFVPFAPHLQKSHHEHNTIYFHRKKNSSFSVLQKKIPRKLSSFPASLSQVKSTHAQDFNLVQTQHN